MTTNKQALRQTAEKAQEHGVFNMDIHSEILLALLDELEAAEKRIADLMEKQRLIDICQGQGLEHRISAEKRAESAEKRVAELESITGALRELRPGHLTIAGEKIGIYMRDEVDAALNGTGTTKGE
jgi:hypothetical protein